MTKNDFLGFLHAGDFKQLFLECGWNNPTTTAAYPIPVGEEIYSVSEVAQKGLKIYVCKVAKMPEASVRRQIDAKLRKLSHDYFLIFVSTDEDFHHLWSVPVKSIDKRQLVTIEYLQDDQAAFLLEKVNAISFSFDEEPTIVDVVDRVNAAFLVNTTDVTKKFYQGFRKQHDLFVKGIQGVKDDPDRQWYASVMLNRLMFCYFVQKKGFLDLNENYLADKLAWVQKTRGENKFDSFYRSFLRNLFSDGLNQPSKRRTKYFIKTYGRIPYLNGGMFAEHEIESRNRDIDIPDQVFEKLFAFFDQWHWHLDNRLTASGRDINPDVLGYIFEQYINDRAQMGAYYTKEDITEYIGRNCILPFLFSKVLGRDARPARPPHSEKWIWDFLRDSGDRYIFAAVKKGVDLPLPDYIERGVSTVERDLRARRSRWNEKADAAYALPTEIWRETVARRQRYAEVRGKIEKGEISDIHDFITYNLDIRSFAEDVLRETDDHHLVGHFYKAVREVTVLDPTCGSGAFLFAALNILEPLYEICLDRMEEFHAKNNKLFKDELAEIKDRFRSNQKYFVYKNIILRNLYGVDIMHEATEIARLRLFLKMMAVVDVDPYDENLGLDPLPDIDFNVKCGNTLVGYASEQEIQDGLVNGDMFAWAELKGKIDDELKKGAMAFKYFRDQQLDLNADNSSLAETKAEVKKRLAAIRTLLDDQLYDKKSGKKKAQWLADTQPFHWYTEFYPIMAERGGFDVIIGNPPYLEFSKVNNYSVSGYQSISCNNLYALVVERSKSLLNDMSRLGMIVPISISSAEAFLPLRKSLDTRFNYYWFAHYSNRPGQLFEGAQNRLTIFVAERAKTDKKIFATKYHRWDAKNGERQFLFSKLQYEECCDLSRKCVCKAGNVVVTSVLSKLINNVQLGLQENKNGRHEVGCTEKFMQAPVIFRLLFQ
ncbi:MAG: Eco57I restriction-modification methylase domain-containing protein, partial [bacterium]|nr:Eco57I restriction-modification methylase domain-containing protein [bacterium]